ncbi:NAD(P)-binding domain-containing protein [Miniimonas arenae]|uniref:NAD(P)-binding domain-containing protein n=1 Tax=Miniimonas arenae TaxID=676201 RepID=UPI0028B13F12|nr:NAD(P)-binding domain-containing protein [Miniimonas arenae]
MKTESTDVVVIGAGQAGLSAARSLTSLGLEPVVLERRDGPSGAWVDYYDSLTLFSPARFSSLPGLAFPGDPGRYPHRDEVVSYLAAYARTVPAEVRYGTSVTAVERLNGMFLVRTADGQEISARSVISAAGSFTRPVTPDVVGRDAFAGVQLHSSAYRSAEPFHGARVLVVGGGNSAVQIALELSSVATVTLASRSPVAFTPQRILGRDIHFWLRRSGFDSLPIALSSMFLRGSPVLDDGRHRAMLRSGRVEAAPMFTSLVEHGVTWPDGTSSAVDVIIWATGFAPELTHLRPLLPAPLSGQSPHQIAAPLDLPGLALVGLERQRSFASNTLRGVGRDAEHVSRRVAAYLRT